MRTDRRGAFTALIAAVSGLAGVIQPSALWARPYSLDDLLRLSRFQGVAASPDGRRLALQLLGPYDQSRTYASEAETDLALGRMAWLDLDGPTPRLRWTPRATGEGLTFAGWSPSGRRMALTRWRSGRIELAVAGPDHARPRGTGVVLEQKRFGRTLQWASDRRLFVLTPVMGRPPADLAQGARTFAKIEALWRAKIQGRRPSLQLDGTGRFADLGRSPVNALLELDLASHRRRRLAEGDFDDLELSPDHHRIALIDRQGEARLPPDPRLGPADDGRMRGLRIVDLVSGADTRPAAGYDILPGLLAWCGSGDLLVFGRRDPRRPWDEGTYLRVKRDGRVEPLQLGAGRRPAMALSAQDSERRALPHAACLSDQPMVLTSHAPGRQDWTALTPDGPRDLTSDLAHPPSDLAAISSAEALLVADGALWRVSPPFAPAVRVAAEADLSVARAPEADRRLRPPLNAAPAPSALLLSARQGPSAVVWRWERSDRRLALPSGSQPLALGRSGLLAWARDAHGVERLLLLNGRPSRTLLTLNPELARTDPVEAVALQHLSLDGSPSTDWLYLPPRRAGAPPPPLVILPYPYPGQLYPTPPVWARPGFLAFTATPAVLAPHGYAVLIPNLPRRSSDTGREGLAAELDRAVDAAVASGRIDPKRIALWGQSYGGYTSLVAVEASSRYAAVIAEAAPADLFGTGASGPPWAEAWPSLRASLPPGAGWTEAGQAQLHAFRWTRPDLFAAASPLVHADRITAPVLLVTGDQDFVPAGQAQAMFTALRRLDKDAELATFWGEEHVVESPANLRALYRTAFHFLDWAFIRKAGSTALSPNRTAAYPTTPVAAGRE